MTTRTRHLTEGPIFPLLLRFFLPLFLSALFQQLYYVIDGLIVARAAGKLAFAALDATANFLRLPLVLHFGLSAGATILIGQAFGARQYRRVRRLIHSLVLIGATIGLTIAVLSFPLTRLGLSWMNVPPEMVPHSRSYLSVVFLGALPLCLYNLGAGSLRALGNSKKPLFYLFFSSTVNIILDLIFVSLLGKGAAGAA